MDDEAASTAGRVCFLICPIGEPDSPQRERSDSVMKFIVKPAVGPLGYQTLRADQINSSGMITTEILEQVRDAPLVVADLTDYNPNVFYKLAIRHIARRPVIHIIHESQRPPFDTSDARAIPYNHTSVPEVARAVEEMHEQAKRAESGTVSWDNPITHALNSLELRASEQPAQRELAKVATTVEEIRQALASQRGFQRLAWNPGYIEQVMEQFAVALDRMGHLRLMGLGVPTDQATDLARRLGTSWEVFQEAIDRLTLAGMLFHQGAAGSAYVELTDLGRKFVGGLRTPIGEDQADPPTARSSP
jgi:hypothetical protein